MSLSKGSLILLIFAAIMSVVLPLLMCWRGTWGRPIEIDMNSTSAIHQEQDLRGHLHFAVASLLLPEPNFAEHHELIHYLAAQLNAPVELVQRKSYQEVNDLLRHGSIQMAVICSGAYLAARSLQIPLEILAVPVYPEGPVNYSFIIVRSDSKLQTMQDLRNHSFAFSDPISLTGHYYPISFFLDQGIPHPYKFFSKTTFAYSHERCLQAVMDGTADGAAINDQVYNWGLARDPTIKNRLRIIHKSPPLGVKAVVSPLSLDAALRQKIQTALLTMGDSPQGREVLKKMELLRFEIPAPGLYEPNRQVFETARTYLAKTEKIE